MRIVHLSYAIVNQQTDPQLWLKRIDFFTGVLDALATKANVTSFHCIGYEGSLIKNGVNYFFLKQSGFDHLFPIRLHRMIKMSQPDVIIIHGLIFPWQVILLRWQFGRHVRIVLQHHLERPLTFPRNFFQKWSNKFVKSYLFTCVEHSAEWVANGIIKDQYKIKEVFEASSAFYPMNHVEAKERTKVTGYPVYLWVGRLHSRKDPITIIKAFINFLDKCPRASLYMVFHTTELLPEVESLLSSQPQKTRSIHLIGEMEHADLLYWYNSADFFILGSKHEGTVISVCEAMSCSCIPILSDIPSFRAMTGHQCGMLFTPGDVASLQERLEHSLTLNMDLEKRKTLEQFNRALSFQAIADKIYDVVSSG